MHAIPTATARPGSSRRLPFQHLLRCARSASLAALFGLALAPGSALALSLLDEGEGDGHDWLYDESSARPDSTPDPLEKLNRAFFDLNGLIYGAFIRPVSRAVDGLLPRPVRRGLANVLDHVKAPVRTANHLLQGEPTRAGDEVKQFFYDSLVGFGGWFRPSETDHPEWVTPEVDFGLTLGSWGLGHGLYLVVPLLGPVTPRDGLGMAADGFLNPLNHALDREPRLALSGSEFLLKAPERMNAYYQVTQGAFDPYRALRDAHLQRRAYLLGLLAEEPSGADDRRP